MFTPFSTSIEDSEWHRIEGRLSKAWPAICKAAREYLGEYRRRRPDRIRIYIRPDCGTVFFSFDAGRDYYAEIASVGIQQLERDYFGLPMNDERHSELFATVGRVITGSLRDANALTAVRALAEEFGLSLSIVEYDDLETERDVLLALGEF